MTVKLLHATPEPDQIVGLAAMVCRNPEGATAYARMWPNGGANKIGELADKCRQSGHMSVFEHVSYTFLIDGISRACSHQLVRHRLASFTQASQRYTLSENGIMPHGFDGLQAEIWVKAMRDASQSYERLVNLGTPLEDARSVLPNAASTTLIMTMNARELAHFLELRLCNKAQREIRELAQEIHKLAREHFPLLFEHVGPPCTQSGCKERIPCEAARAGDRELFEDKFGPIYPERKS